MFKTNFSGFSVARKQPLQTIAAQNVITLRRKYKLTRAKLGWLLGVSGDTVRSWEKGFRKPERPMMMLIDMMSEGFVIPDRIRRKYQPKYNAERRWLRVPKYTTSLDQTQAMLMNPKGDGT